MRHFLNYTLKLTYKYADRENSVNSESQYINRVQQFDESLKETDDKYQGELQ